MAGNPVVSEIVAPQTAQSSFRGKLAPNCAPSLRGLCRLVAAASNSGAVPPLDHRLDQRGDEVMVWLVCSKVLGPHDQLLHRFQGIDAQGDRPNPTFRLAFLEADLASQQVDPL